jgi:hypothetical protein
MFETPARKQVKACGAEGQARARSEVQHVKPGLLQFSWFDLIFPFRCELATSTKALACHTQKSARGPLPHNQYPECVVRHFGKPAM